MNALVGSKSLIINEEKSTAAAAAAPACKFKKSTVTGLVTAPAVYNDATSFVRPFFDCYRSLPTELELTLPDARALVSQRQKFLSLVREDLRAGRVPDAGLLGLRTSVDIRSDRLSFWLCAASSERSADWLQLEEVIAYHRLWRCHESGTLVYNMFSDSKRVTIGNITQSEQPPSVACAVCCPGRAHPLSKHMPSFDKHSLVQTGDGSVLCLDSFLLRCAAGLAARFADTKRDSRF